MRYTKIRCPYCGHCMIYNGQHVVDDFVCLSCGHVGVREEHFDLRLPQALRKSCGRRLSA